MMKRKSCIMGNVGSHHSNGATCYFLEDMGGTLNSVMMTFVGQKSVARLYPIPSLLLQQPACCSVMPPRLLLRLSKLGFSEE